MTENKDVWFLSDFQVNVGENKDWKLGAVRESSQRKGLFDMSPDSGYYSIWWSGNHLRALTAPPPVKIKVSGRLRRVGVYLDCEEGQLIFYNAKTGSELYSFTSVEFSEKMFPLFGTGDKDVPLVLMSVSVSVPEWSTLHISKTDNRISLYVSQTCTASTPHVLHMILIISTQYCKLCKV